MNRFPIFNKEKNRLITGFIDRTGAIVITPKFEFATRFKGGFSVALLSRQWSVIDTQEQVVLLLPGSPALPQSLEEGAVILHVARQWQIYRIDGRISTIPLNSVENVMSFSEGVAPVRFLDQSCTFIDKNGKPLFDRIYKDVRPFSEGASAVLPLNGPWEFIDRSGCTMFQTTMLDFPPSLFRNGFSCVVGSEGTEIVSWDGRAVSRFKDTDQIWFAGSPYVIARKANKYSVCSLFGEALLPYTPGLIRQCNSDIFVVRDAGSGFKGLWSACARDWIISPKYNSIWNCPHENVVFCEGDAICEYRDLAQDCNVFWEEPWVEKDLYFLT